MKIISRLLFFFLLMPFALNAQVKWLPLEEAIQLQQTAPKKIFLFFYSSAGQMANVMEQNTFGNPVIQNLMNENYYPVKFDVLSEQAITWGGRTFNPKESTSHINSDFHQFAQFMNVNATPSSVFLDDEGLPITIIQGALTAAELEPYLQFMRVHAATGTTSATDWQTFLKTFKPQVKLRNR